jgi:predicted DNA-binding transcriptional regulator AlpA
MSPRKFPAHDRAVREPERLTITGVPTSSWYQLQNEGRAPKPFPIGDRTVAWSLNELTEWVEAAKASRGDDWQQVGDAAMRVIKKSRR